MSSTLTLGVGGVGGEGIYKAEASHGSVALPVSSTYERSRARAPT